MVELKGINIDKEQADKISESLASGSSSSTNKNVQISTVDAFQGGEKDIIILSTVRTSESNFMTNRPRINVSLTRAKFFFFFFFFFFTQK
jgi:superfamily I DNA and/or RNA helicase